MAKTTPVLVDVRKRYSSRSRWILDGVSLDLAQGTRTLVLGANGSGKSTLLGTIAGVIRPSGGQVHGRGTVSYVPDRLPSRLRMSATDYLVHMGRIRAMERGLILSRSAELLERLDLQPGPDVSFDVLSKGNRQKVVLCQAFLDATDILVLDEPYNGLDAHAARVVDELVEEAQGAGSAVVMSAPGTAAGGTAERALRIEDGSLRPAAAGEVRPTEGAVRIELLAAARPGAQDLRARPEVIHVSEETVATVFLVRGDEVDSFLRAALDGHWSVRSVRQAGYP